MNEQVPSEQFVVGEIVILAKPQYIMDIAGLEAEVIGPLKLRRNTRTDEPFLCYVVQLQDGRRFGAEPHQLRKKRPPRKDLEVVRWADCPWQPESINV